MSDIANGGKSETNIRLQTISKVSLDTLVTAYNKSNAMVLEFKKSPGALLSRKKSPEIPNTPIAILPGTRQKLQIRIDNAGNFNFSSTKWGESVEDFIITLPNLVSSRKVTESVNRDVGMAFIDDIWLIQQYLIALHSRLKNSTQQYVLIPSSLYQAIYASEGIFDNEGEQAFVTMKTQIGQFKKWFLQRVNSLYSEFKKLESYIAISNGATSSFKKPVIKLDKSLVQDLFHFDEEQLTSQQGKFSFSEYICSKNVPNQHNMKVVLNLIQNALTDLISPSKWLSNVATSELTYPDEQVVLRMETTLFSEEYAEVKRTLEPVKKALESDRGKNPNVDYKAALEECNQIFEYCDREAVIDNLVTHSPSSLNEKITNIIQKYKLTQIMEDEICRNFSGFYNKLLETHKKQIPPKVLDDSFVRLTSIKYNFDQCFSLIQNAQNLVRENATARDSQSKREDADTEISNHKKGLNKFRSENDSLDLLDGNVKKKLIEIEEWYENLQSSLSNDSVEESVLWIGLGQAGGQILRECLLYCLSNLSDARCTALLTALGINPSDLKNVHKWTKDIYSTDDKKKTEAETDLKTLFDKKVHVLAINLGEEVDALANKDQPGYFLWGDKVAFDKTSRTVRTRKNILKLKPGGEGAGGSTGVGRAFGFRYKEDISDVMKDVGRKGHSKPKHIVITHSLAGGSGSGMVLPVLQQARRTFGSEPIIWVISVGEGASEDRNVAMVNTPFIISDILQANYDGIHAIHDPIEVNQWRSFSKEMSQESERMNQSLLDFIGICGIKFNTDQTLVSNLNSILDGGYLNKYSSDTMSILEAYANIFSISKDPNYMQFKDETPLNLGAIPQLDIPAFEKRTYHDSMTALNEILPNSIEQASIFTSWCKTQALGGNRPAAQFWGKWLKCQFDPLSLFLEGREKDKQTTADAGEMADVNYFVPQLTSVHIKSVINRVYHDNHLTQPNGKIPDYQGIAAGLTPLLKIIDDAIGQKDNPEDKKILLDQIKAKFDDYGGGLNKFNSAKERMTIHINSLSGVGSDPLIKSIIVSNLHLEKGVNSTSHLESSGKAYTVYNSVIFDLMLNIIGPRLPTESGVFEPMDETFDHMDLVGSTSPPLVIGLLNQRDSTSLTEPPIVKEAGIEPAELGFLLNSMFTQESVNPGSHKLLENPLFLQRMTLSSKVQILFQSMFGSRFKYMLQIDPYDVVARPTQGIDKLSDFSEKLVAIWNNSSDDIYDISPTQRENLSKNNGISGLHIANLVRWFSLIAPTTLSRFIGEKRDAKGFEKLIKREGTLWNLLNDSGADEFDIGILRIDPTIQKYVGKDQNINQMNLYETLPKLGIKNAEILRSVAPAYLNSFLPMELLFGCEKIDFAGLDFENSGVSKTVFKEQVESEDDQELNEFIGMVLTSFQDSHSYGVEGKINDIDEEIQELMTDYPEATKCILSTLDLQISSDHPDPSRAKFSLNLHPRLNRYFSAVRDIPIRPADKILPSRSASASLSRYIHSDSMERPLDPDYKKENRTGIASPTFVFGGQIMNQMRNMSLLPDEGKLSLIPMVRLLLLGAENATVFQQRLSSQFRSIGLDSESFSQHFVKIFNENVYTRLEIYNDPGIYGDQVKTIINRLHDSKELFEELIVNLPSGWNNDDLGGLKFLLWILEQEDITFESKENAQEIFRGNIGAIPRVREWLQDLISVIVSGTYQIDAQQANDNLTDESQSIASDEGADEPKKTVSNENSTLVGLKQLFYDISYLTNEGLSQAEYLNKDYKHSRNVHFEMTGFSDRLIGKPEGLLLLIHDRNPKLAMDTIQQSVRESITYSFGGQKLGSPKAFSTAADFGPSSYLTVVLQNAPAAGISDQFQMLMADRSNGLVGSNPFWSFSESKLHPYILLYNLLWLSVSLPEWTSLDNKEYMRRFQIPTSVIEHHYSNPIKLDNDRVRLEKDKTSFEGDVSMPLDDKRDYTNAIKGELSGVRNILQLIGIMALRHESAANIQDDKVWGACGIDVSQYKLLKEMHQTKAEMMNESHLINIKKAESKPKKKKFGKFKKSKNASEETNENLKPDTLEDRAKAWFKAYAAWSKYKPEPTGNVSQIDSFEATLLGEDL